MLDDNGRETAAKITFWKRAALGAGGAVENGFQNAPLAMANPIYNVGLGVSPIVVGWAMAVPRIWELIFDPLIGILSDRTECRFGRRLPYLVVGMVGSFLSFIAMWCVPESFSKEQIGIWLIISALLFYTFYSLFAIPYSALTIEVTKAGAERIGVMSARTFFSNLSALAIMWLYWGCQRSFFPTAVNGMRYIGVVFGAGMCLCGLLVIGAAWRLGKVSAPDALVNRDGKVRAGQLLRLKPTQCIMGALFSVMLSFTLVGFLNFYLLAFYACGGDLKEAAYVGAIKGTVSTLAGLCACPVVAGLADYFGKGRIFAALMALGILSSISMWFLLTPVNPYYSIVSDLGVAIALAGFWTLMPTFLGDLCDSYQQKTGVSCQGVLSALYGVAAKIGASVALLITGYILVVCGFSPEMAPELMGGPITKMRILYVILPCVGIIAALICISFFRRQISQMMADTSTCLGLQERVQCE